MTFLRQFHLVKVLQRLIQVWVGCLRWFQWLCWIQYLDIWCLHFHGDHKSLVGHSEVSFQYSLYNVASYHQVGISINLSRRIYIHLWAPRRSSTWRERSWATLCHCRRWLCHHSWCDQLRKSMLPMALRLAPGTVWASWRSSQDRNHWRHSSYSNRVARTFFFLEWRRDRTKERTEASSKFQVCLSLPGFLESLRRSFSWCWPSYLLVVRL